MKIVADMNIAYVKEAFADFGEVELISGRDINNNHLKDAAILLVRSVTRVNQELLENTGIQFVASATIGLDHIDRKYLAEKGIGFANAPGASAKSVADYVTAALLLIKTKKDINLTDMTLGIIGAGNVGSSVLERAKALGIRCLLNDPPKKRQTDNPIYLPLTEVLKQSDILSIHVPLNRSGQDKTLYLVDDEFISLMKPGTVLINTSRGQVIDETALRAGRNKIADLILDVWEHEPNISIETLDLADIATPHIAGYSYEGKIRGTIMIYQACCQFFSKNEKWDFDSYLQSSKPPVIDVTKSNNIVFDAVNKAYPIMEDDRELRAIKEIKPDQQGFFFDQARKNYHLRREFSHYLLRCNNNMNSSEAEMLKRIGFSIILHTF